MKELDQIRARLEAATPGPAPADISRLLAAVEAVEDLIGWLDAASADDEPMYAKGKVSARATADRLRATLAELVRGLNNLLNSLEKEDND